MKSIKQLNNPMLIDLIAGNIIFFVIGEILICASFLIFGVKWDLVTGYLIGSLISIGMVIHMAYAIDEAVRLNEETALKHTRKTYIIRLIATIAVFAVVWFLKLGNVGAVLLGMMILKFSAYAQPITHRLTSKIFK